MDNATFFSIDSLSINLVAVGVKSPMTASGKSWITAIFIALSWFMSSIFSDSNIVSITTPKQ